MPNLKPYNIKKKLPEKDEMKDVISHNTVIPFYTKKYYYEIEYYNRLFVNPTDQKEYIIRKPNFIKLLTDYKIPIVPIQEQELIRSPVTTIPAYLFMVNLLKNHALSNNVNICINAPSDDFLKFDFIYLNTDTYQFQIEKHVYENILNNCKKADLIVFPIGIYGVYGNSNTHVRHANIALIDNKSKTIEYFESFGIFEQKYSEIPIAFFNFIKTNFDFAKDYTFDKRVITKLQSDDKFCIYWCLYVLWVRIMNYHNHISSNIIELYLDSDGYNNNIDVLTLLVLFTQRLVETETLPEFNLFANYTDIIKSVPSGNSFMEYNIAEVTSILKNKLQNKDFNNVGDILQNLSQYVNYIDFEKIVNQVLKKS